jgi:hypothetical protein
MCLVGLLHDRVPPGESTLSDVLYVLSGAATLWQKRQCLASAFVRSTLTPPMSHVLAIETALCSRFKPNCKTLARCFLVNDQPAKYQGVRERFHPESNTVPWATCPSLT